MRWTVETGHTVSQEVRVPVKGKHKDQMNLKNVYSMHMYGSIRKLVKNYLRHTTRNQPRLFYPVQEKVWGQFQIEVEQSPESFVWLQTGCSVVGSHEVAPQPRQVLHQVPLDPESQSYYGTESHSQQMPAKRSTDENIH